MLQPTLLRTAAAVPALFAPDAAAERRTLEFFTAHIRNANTRKAYAHAGEDFARWCRRHRIADLRSVQALQRFQTRISSWDMK